jgi:hypothetical protein
LGQTEILATLTLDQVKATWDKIAVHFPGPPSQLTQLQRFLKWSVSDRRQRTISPFSTQTVSEWTENSIKEGTLESLRAAIEIDPANARLVAHFGFALANLAVAEETNPDVARRALAEADYQSRRAVELAYTILIRWQITKCRWLMLSDQAFRATFRAFGSRPDRTCASEANSTPRNL